MRIRFLPLCYETIRCSKEVEVRGSGAHVESLQRARRAHGPVPSLRHAAALLRAALLRGSEVIIYAHRGDTTQHLENTRGAFDAALKRGFKAFELDLLRTKDNQIVVFHDFWLRRLFGRWRRVRGIELSDFQKIFPDLLLFDEFIDRYGREKLVINFEVKDDVETLSRIHRQLHRVYKPVISSFRPSIVDAAAAAGLEAGYLFDSKKDFLQGRDQMKTRRLHISHLMLRDESAGDLYGAYEVHSYTVNEPTEALALSKLGFVKGIFTDNPSLLEMKELTKDQRQGRSKLVRKSPKVKPKARLTKRKPKRSGR